MMDRRALLSKEEQPTPDAKKRYTINQERDRLDLTIGVGILGLLAVIYYASLTARSVQISQQALELSERPWIAVTSHIAEPLTFLPDGSAQIVMNEDLENVGNSQESSKSI